MSTPLLTGYIIVQQQLIKTAQHTTHKQLCHNDITSKDTNENLTFSEKF